MEAVLGRAALTPAEAATLHDRLEGVAWFAIPAPCSVGVIARAHTEAHDGGRLLSGYLAARDLADLHAMMPPGLAFDEALGVGSPPGCLGWWSGWQGASADVQPGSYAVGLAGLLAGGAVP